MVEEGTFCLAELCLQIKAKNGNQLGVCGWLWLLRESWSQEQGGDKGEDKGFDRAVGHDRQETWNLGKPNEKLLWEPGRRVR